MTQALETTFVNVVTTDDAERRRRWRLDDPQLFRLAPRQETTLEALEIAAREARNQGRVRHTQALEMTRDMLLARLAPGQARRIESDTDAVLTSMGRVTRPGPTTSQPPHVMDVIIEALRGPFRLRILYGDDAPTERIIEPHGLLLGHRNYLVARQPSSDDRLRNFRVDRIREASALDESFSFEPGFSLDDHAAQAFGVWQDPEQYGEVIWRFAPEAAERAAQFCFHPRQIVEPQNDGSLVVRFHASGWLEMAWHLYQWGDKVEVLAPEPLRALVAGHRRDDFEALP